MNTPNISSPTKKNYSKIPLLAMASFDAIKPYINIYGCGVKYQKPDARTETFTWGIARLITKECSVLHALHKKVEQNLKYKNGEPFSPEHFGMGILTKYMVRDAIYKNQVYYYTSGRQKGLLTWDIDAHKEWQTDQKAAWKLLSDLLGENASWQQSLRGENGISKIIIDGKVKFVNALAHDLQRWLQLYLWEHEILCDFEVKGTCDTWDKCGYLAKIPCNHDWNFDRLREFGILPEKKITWLQGLLLYLQNTVNVQKAEEFQTYLEKQYMENQPVLAASGDFVQGGTVVAVPLPAQEKPKPKQKQEFDLTTIRGGNWPLGLEHYAREGLPHPGSLDILSFELAKWLYFVELFHMPHDQREYLILDLLWTWVSTRHNGHTSRIGNPLGEADLRRQLANFVKLARNQDEDAKRYFFGLRQKRQQGYYRRVILLEPLLRGNIASESFTTHNNTVYFISESSLTIPLPEIILERIDAFKGRNKIASFATKLINWLHLRQGRGRVPRNDLYTLLGYVNPNQLAKYKRILVEAEILKEGGYKKGAASKTYLLTTWANNALEAARQAKIA